MWIEKVRGMQVMDAVDEDIYRENEKVDVFGED